MNVRHHVFRLRPWKRHSLVLAVLGTLYILNGVTFIFADASANRRLSLQVAISIMPLWAWGGVFIATGGLGVLSSRWPPASETWGYTALAGLSALWACFYAWGVAYGAPVETVTGVFTWGGMSFLWWAISGLVNPSSAAAHPAFPPPPLSSLGDQGDA